MISNTIKILKKLIANPMRFEVSLYHCNAQHKKGYFRYCQIEFKDNNYRYKIDIWRDDDGRPKDFMCWTLYEKECGSHIMHGTQSELDDYNKYEILDLCEKLKYECECHTSTAFRNFADEVCEEFDDTIE